MSLRELLDLEVVIEDMRMHWDRGHFRAASLLADQALDILYPGRWRR